MSTERSPAPGFGLQLRWPSDGPDDDSDPEPSAPSSTPPADDEDALTWPPLGATADRVEPADKTDGLAQQNAVEENGRHLSAMVSGLDAPTDPVWAAVARLSMQVDGLTAATNSLSLGISDRLSNYTETLERLAQHQSRVLDELRSSVEKFLSELRTRLPDVVDASAEQARQLDVIHADLGALGELVEGQQTDSRHVVTTAERAVKALATGLDGFCTRVLEKVSTGGGTAERLAELSADMASLRHEIQRAAPDATLRTELVELIRLRGRLDPDSPPDPMSESQLQALATVLGERIERMEPRVTSEQTEQIADVVVKRLQQSFMLVDDGRD